MFFKFHCPQSFVSRFPGSCIASWYNVKMIFLVFFFFPTQELEHDRITPSWFQIEYFYHFIVEAEVESIPFLKIPVEILVRNSSVLFCAIMIWETLLFSFSDTLLTALDGCGE